jgi:hypothetical protein
VHDIKVGEISSQTIFSAENNSLHYNPKDCIKLKETDPLQTYGGGAKR